MERLAQASRRESRESAAIAALATLDDFERRVIETRFGLRDGEPKTVERCAELLDATSERIRRAEARALRKLRRRSKADVLS